MKNDVQNHLKNGKHLPEFLKDFHDQKDLFKARYNHLNDNESKIKDKISWVDAQIFTIDYFLWYMGMHGYKLQKTRDKETKFMDLQDSVNNFKP